MAITGRKTIEAHMEMHGGCYQSAALETYVSSGAWKPGERGGFKVVKESPASLVRHIRRRTGKHTFLAGGGELGRSFLHANLVDELFLGIVPILLGQGVPAFPGGFPRYFSLVQCKPYSNSSVALTYIAA